MALEDVVPAQEGSFLVAQLASRYFRPGGVVKGVVRLMSDQDTPDARSEITHVVAQLHGHVTVDSNLLTLPVVHVEPPQRETAQLDRKLSEDGFLFDKMGVVLPDVRSFSGDTGTCIYRSPPAVLLSDINIAPTPSEAEAASAAKKLSGVGAAVAGASSLHVETAERCTREFAIALPDNACPTFRGSSARVFYVVSITAQCAVADSKPVTVHLPFEVYAAEYFFEASTLASASHIATSQCSGSSDSTKDDALKSTETVGGSSRVGRRTDRSVSSVVQPVGVRKGSEIAFELRPSLMHGRVETELLQRAQTSIFTIGKDSNHLVRFLLTKQSYQPGEVLLGVFDFSRASIPCYEVSTTLCLEETLSNMALDPERVVQSKVFGSFKERTLGVLQTSVRFCIPQDALPSIRTDLVRFQWLLHFEFSAGAPATSAPAEQEEMSAAAAAPLRQQTFQWQVPVIVQPAAATERSHLANVPHKLFSGSGRAVALAASSA